jgi:hypothetical protein
MEFLSLFEILGTNRKRKAYFDVDVKDADEDPLPVCMATLREYFGADVKMAISGSIATTAN